MTCMSCVKKVETALSELDGIKNIDVNLENKDVSIEMSQHLPLTTLNSTLSKAGNYKLIEKVQTKALSDNEEKSFWTTYKPVLLIFLYIFSATTLIELNSESIDIMRWMRHFMAGFFLTFSFFKMLNLKGFKDSYLMYDIIARRFPSWGYIYAFTELFLGIAFLINFSPIITSSVTFIVMSVSIIGVLQTVLDKKTIKCACLGDVFNLPMSTVTIIEDGLMIGMAAIMLIQLVV